MMFTLRSSLLVITVTLPLFNSLFSKEGCVYPIATSTTTSGDEQLFVIYQESHGPQKLLLWNPINKETCELLSSDYCPTVITPLCDGVGFSFVDRGRLRIKRDPIGPIRALDFVDAVYDIRTVAWLDSHHGYIGAKKRNRDGIFQISTHGALIPLAYSRVADYHFPQKRDDSLFYVERSEDEQRYSYEVVQASYPYTSSSYHQGNSNRSSSSKKVITIAYFGSRALIYLHMISTTQGYVVEQHQQETEGNRIRFSCYFIERIEEEQPWKIRFLTCFYLPRILFDRKHNVMPDLLLAHMPKIVGNRVYYFNVDHAGAASGILQLRCVSVTAMALDDQLVYEGNLFGMVATKQAIYCGRVFTDTDSDSSERLSVDLFKVSL